MNRTMLKSYLYSPADTRERLLKAGTRGADAVIADLEDSITANSRQVALENIVKFLRSGAGHSERWVRLSLSDIEGQLKKILLPQLDGLVLPEVDLAQLNELDGYLRKFERTSNTTDTQIPVMGLVEDAAALRDIHAIAAHPRITRLGMGEADLSADLGVEPGPAGTELLHARSTVVAASAAAQIEAPCASTSTNFRDLAALEKSTRKLLALGFRARTAIHPGQISIINSTFTPSDKELETAEDLIRRYEKARERSAGVALDAQGNMLDLAVVRRAYEVSNRASGTKR